MNLLRQVVPTAIKLTALAAVSLSLLLARPLHHLEHTHPASPIEQSTVSHAHACGHHHHGVDEEAGDHSSNHHRHSENPEHEHPEHDHECSICCVIAQASLTVAAVESPVIQPAEIEPLPSIPHVVAADAPGAIPARGPPQATC